MLNDFTELGVTPEILRAIDEMGFIEPTEVQSQAIPPILNHEDVIVMSKTGSGKTAVFGIPMLQMISFDEAGPQGLILTPTRELAVQIDEDLNMMAKYLPHKTAVVYGQHSMNVEVAALRGGASIVTGTPGRVFDHLQQGNLITKNIRFLVLDEADRMLDMGFLDQVIRIVRKLPRNRVTLLFSATIPPEVQRISRDFMNNPVMIEIESQTMTVDSVRQFYYRVDRNEKHTQLNRLLLMEQPESCIIFCNTRIAVDRVVNFLTRKGYHAQALHGDIPQARRTKTIEQFKKGAFRILVATDVAARGLHVESLSLVINYDVPLEMDGYVHRIGRTGRAGKEGLAISLVTSDDIMSLYAIEEHTGAMIEEAELPTDSMLADRKEGAEEWILANSIRFSSDAIPMTGTRAKAGEIPAVKPNRPSHKPVRHETVKPAAQPVEKKITGAPAMNTVSATSAASAASAASVASTVSGKRQTDSSLRRPTEKPPVAVSEKDLKTVRRPHMRIVGGTPGESSGVSRPARPVPGAAAQAQAPAIRTENDIRAGKKDAPGQKEEKAAALKTILGRIFKK